MEKKSPRIIPKLTKSSSKSSTLNKDLKKNKNLSKKDELVNDKTTNVKSISDLNLNAKENKKQQEKQNKTEQQQLKFQQNQLKQEKKLLQKKMKLQQKLNDKENKYGSLKLSKFTDEPENIMANASLSNSFNSKNFNSTISEESKFVEGIQFKGKLIGIEPVMAARGDKMCQNALKNLHLLRRSTSSHKQRIIINIKLTGIQLLDQKSNELVANHVINLISYITRDSQNNRSFGYVYGTPDVGHQFIAIKSEKDSMYVMNAIGELFTYVYIKKKKEKIQRELEVKNLEAEKMASSMNTIQKAQEDRNNQILMNLIKQQERQQLHESHQHSPQSSQFDKMYNIYNFPSNNFNDRNFCENSYNILPPPPMLTPRNENENNNYSSSNANLNNLNTYGSINSERLNSNVSNNLENNLDKKDSIESITSQLSQNNKIDTLKNVVSSIKKVNDKYKEWQTFDDNILYDDENKTLKEESDSIIDDNDWASFSPPNHSPPPLTNFDTNDESSILNNINKETSTNSDSFDRNKSASISLKMVQKEHSSVNIKEKNYLPENNILNKNSNYIQNEEIYFKNKYNDEYKNSKDKFFTKNVDNNYNFKDLDESMSNSNNENSLFKNLNDTNQDRILNSEQKHYSCESINLNTTNRNLDIEHSVSNKKYNQLDTKVISSFDVLNNDEKINSNNNKFINDDKHLNILSNNVINVNNLEESNLKNNFGSLLFNSKFNNPNESSSENFSISNQNLEKTKILEQKESLVDLNDKLPKSKKLLTNLDDKYAIFNKINSIESNIFYSSLEKDSSQKYISPVNSVNIILENKNEKNEKENEKNEKENEKNETEHVNVNKNVIENKLEKEQFITSKKIFTDSFLDNSYSNHENRLKEKNNQLNQYNENTTNSQDISTHSYDLNKESGFSSLPSQLNNSFYCQFSASPDLIESHKRFLNERQEKLDQIDQIFEVEKEKIRNQQKQMNQIHFKQQKNLLNEQKNQQQEFYQRQKQQRHSILHQLQLQRLSVVQFDHYKLQLQQKLQNDQKCLMNEFIKRQQKLKMNQMIEQNKLLDKYKILEQQYLEKQGELLNSEFEFESEMLDIPNIFEEDSEFDFDNNFKSQLDLKLCNEFNKLTDIQTSSNNSSPRLLDRSSTSCSITSLNSQNPFAFEGLKQIEKFLSDSFDHSLSFLNNDKDTKSLEKSFDGSNSSINANSIVNFANFNDENVRNSFNLNITENNLFSDQFNFSNNDNNDNNFYSTKNLNENSSKNILINTQTNSINVDSNENFLSNQNLFTNDINRNKISLNLEPIQQAQESQSKVFKSSTIKTDLKQNSEIEFKNSSTLFKSPNSVNHDLNLFKSLNTIDNTENFKPISINRQHATLLPQKKLNCSQFNLVSNNEKKNKYSETLPKSMKNYFNKFDEKNDPFNCSYVDKKLDEITRIKELRQHTQEQLVSLTMSESENTSNTVSNSPKTTIFKNSNQLSIKKNEKKSDSLKFIKLNDNLIDTFDPFDPLFNKNDNKNFVFNSTLNQKAFSNLDLFSDFYDSNNIKSKNMQKLPLSNSNQPDNFNSNDTKNNLYFYPKEKQSSEAENSHYNFCSDNLNYNVQQNKVKHNRFNENSESFGNYENKESGNSFHKNIFTNNEDVFNDDFFN